MIASIRMEAPPGTSLKGLVRGYLLTHQTEGSSPDTVEYYRGMLSRFLWYANKEAFPDDVRLLNEWNVRESLGYVGAEVGRWGKTGNGSESSSRKASPRTVHHYYSVLRAFFNWAVREGFLSDSPVHKVNVSKAKAKVIQPYSLDHIRKMLQVCDYDYEHGAKLLGSRNKAIILVFLDSGLRLSELAGMQMSDVTIDSGWIKVLGKGRKERMTRIGKVAQKSLWKYLVHRGECSTSAVWLTEEGQPLAGSGIQSAIRRIKQRASIGEEGSVHRLRHTFALNFLRADRNPFNLQYLLGHSSLEMVKHYTSALGMEDALEAHIKASPADSMLR